MFDLEENKKNLSRFFSENKETAYTADLLACLGNDNSLPSSMFLQLEKISISKDFKENLILLLKIKILLSKDNDVLVRTLNQMSFAIEGIKIK